MVLFFSNVSQFPKEHCFLEGSQASIICSSDKSNMHVKMNVEH
jgi:hypothetical protein